MLDTSSANKLEIALTAAMDAIDDFDEAFKLCRQSGAVRADKLMCVGGYSWQAMACIERLVEIGDLRELPSPADSPWQHKVFVLGREE